MGFTQQDLNNVKSALIDLATGKKAVRVTTRNKTVEFAQTDIDKLRTLLSQIQSEVATANGAQSFFLTSTSKGL
ncbi:MAG: hypothetical protein GY874_01935 [Desulfobacteraceae bacterium]|nr:hypothetical protein [Desulfobacteraceae bacterium]